jgi:hypothetical protein
MSKQSRRDFLKTSAAGAVGIAAAGGVLNSSLAKTTVGGWTAGLKINPDINNLRVVYVKDSTMATGDYVNFDTSNTRTDKVKIKANMDKMALALARPKGADAADATAAWKMIFRKPDAKIWDNVTAAIKVNTIGNYHPSKAVVAAIIEGLKAAGVGVKDAKKIVIYDATQNGAVNGLYASLKTDYGVETSGGGGTFKTNIGIDATNVVKDVDILVSCAVCKNHGDGDWGGFTMASKNHIGTVRFGCNNGGPKMTFGELMNITKCDAIIGNPSATVPARQQLAVIDCIWGSTEGGYIGNPNCSPRILVMGTLAGAVDYLTVHKVRKVAPVNASHNDGKVKEYLTTFGYTSDDADKLLTVDGTTSEDGRGWVDAATYTPVATIGSRATLQGNSRAIELSLRGSGLRSSSIRLDLGQHERVSSIEIHDMSGRLVRSLKVASGQNDQLVWDGANSRGRMVTSGTYIATVNGNGASGKLTVAR